MYLEVFELPQWIIFFSFLLLISTALPIALRITRDIRDSSKDDDSAIDTLGMVYMFTIQQGSHTNRQNLSIRMMSMTMALVTLLMFIYYANDITAKMTAGPPPHPIKGATIYDVNKMLGFFYCSPSLSAKYTLFVHKFWVFLDLPSALLFRRHLWTPPKTFDDVLARDYKVILVGFYHLDLLKESPTGSSKHLVYKAFFEKNDPWDGKENDLFRPFSQEGFEWAENFIKEDLKTLFYCAAGCVNWDKDDKFGQRMQVLQMHDTFQALGGYALQGGNSIS